MRAFLIAITALFLATQAARADAIYDWVPLSGGGEASGTLSITDAAYAAGSFSWYLSNFDPDPGMAPPPPGPVTSFSFNYFGMFCTYCGNPPTYGGFNVSMSVDGDQLTGALSANSGIASGIAMESISSSAIWTITDSVEPITFGPDCLDTVNTCNGDTGYWELVSAPTQNVPEPMSGAALALGLLGLGVMRRGSRSHMPRVSAV